jgi:hypothetical protein
MLHLCRGYHLHFLLRRRYRRLLRLVHGSVLTPAEAASSDRASSPLASNLPHATNRGERGWRLWSLSIVAELLLLDADTVHQVLSLLKFQV